MGMGYQGYAKFYTDELGGNDPASAKSVIVLATGASVNLVLEPIYSQGVWGAGWYNAAETTHYADNAIRYEGNIDTELQVGENGAYWNLIQDFAISHRAYPKSLEISPDGSHVYRYLIRKAGTGDDPITINSNESYERDSNNFTHGAYCTSINFSTSAGNVVTSSVGVVAIYREEVNPAGESPSVGNNIFADYSYIKQARGVVAGDVEAIRKMAPLNPGATNVNPIPYWRTDARLYRHDGGPGGYEELLNIGNASANYTPQVGLETVEWNIDVNNNQQILYTCSGTRMPRAVLMGPMSVGGAVTVYNAEGVFDPVTGPDGTNNIDKPYMVAENTWFNVAINVDTDPNAQSPKHVYINVPAVVIESDEYSIQSADSVTNRAFNIKGLGGRCLSGTDIGSFALPPCVMSRYYNVASPGIGDLLSVPWSYNSSSSSYTYSDSGYEAAEPNP